MGRTRKDVRGNVACLATWMPAIHLDMFIRRSKSEGAISWRTDDLARCLDTRGKKPLIIEGVLLLDALSAIEKSPEYLVFVEKAKPQHGRDRGLDDDLEDPREFAPSNQVSRYFERRSPLAQANFRLLWEETTSPAGPRPSAGLLSRR
jgi:hypothetical protein